jgi:hypothetical protein
MLSPQMFGEFVAPDLSRVTAYLDYSMYHLDGVAQMRFLDQIAELPGLNGVQWNPEPVEQFPDRHVGAMKAIREKGLSLYAFVSVEDGLMLTRELGPDGLFFDVGEVQTPDEAERIIGEFTRAAGG